MGKKNVILIDSSSNELNPETIITQVKDSSNASLFTEASGVISTTAGHSINGASISNSSITSDKIDDSNLSFDGLELTADLNLDGAHINSNTEFSIYGPAAVNDDCQQYIEFKPKGSIVISCEDNTGGSGTEWASIYLRHNSGSGGLLVNTDGYTFFLTDTQVGQNEYPDTNSVINIQPNDGLYMARNSIYDANSIYCDEVYLLSNTYINDIEIGYFHDTPISWENYGNEDDGVEIKSKQTVNNVQTTARYVFRTDSIYKTTKIGSAAETTVDLIPRFSEQWYNKNSIVRGKDITSYFTDGTLWKRINGTDGFKVFEDLFLGDWFDMGTTVTCPNSYQSTTGSRYVMIAGFDTYYHSYTEEDDDNYIKFHHIVLVPGKFDTENGVYAGYHFGKHRMNTQLNWQGEYQPGRGYEASSASVPNVFAYEGTAYKVTQAISSSENTSFTAIENKVTQYEDYDGAMGGYYNSEMYNSVIGEMATSGDSSGTINEQLYDIFGSHLKSNTEYITEECDLNSPNKIGGIGSGANNTSEYEVQACLLTEIQVYGHQAYGNGGGETGYSKTQLPLFALCNHAISDYNEGTYYWLRDIASPNRFACVNHYGNAYYSFANYDSFAVRPRFILS